MGKLYDHLNPANVLTSRGTHWGVKRCVLVDNGQSVPKKGLILEHVQTGDFLGVFFFSYIVPG